MIATILEDAGLDPTMAIGGEVKNIGGNDKDGKGDFFVAEACEYERAFLDLFPFAAVITNIEEDHLDTYGDLAHILESFSQFISQIDPKGFLVISSWDANIKAIRKGFLGEVLDYGFDEGVFRAKKVRVCDKKTIFSVYKNDKFLGDVELLVPGAHNILNALAAIATTERLGVAFPKVKESLSRFSGAKRRFEIKGEKDGVLVIDDYAHHPTEIQATLDGLRSYHPNSKVWCIFQAHQYSRTRFLLSDFAKSFEKADSVIIPEIYEARDTREDKEAVSAEILAKEISKVTKNAKHIDKFDDVVEYLNKNVQSGDIVITIGAGPVYKIGETFLKEK